ncbi:MAG TPA: hypothetical protein GX697_00870 [Firmicutes bacterium]|nr:hypothetical protein [Bacillota bacterium]
MKNKDVHIGLDIVNYEPDYTKTWEENLKLYREQYFKAYGEYPPEPEEQK